METYPYCVTCRSLDAGRPVELYRLGDGTYQVISPGRLDRLLFGPDYILAERSIASTLNAACLPDLELRSARILRRSTGEVIASHDEVFPVRELTAAQIGSGLPLEGNAWRFGHYLFVAPHVRDILLSLGCDDLSFSPGLSDFA